VNSGAGRAAAYMFRTRHTARSAVPARNHGPMLPPTAVMAREAASIAIMTQSRPEMSLSNRISLRRYGGSCEGEGRVIRLLDISMQKLHHPMPAGM